MEDPGDPRDRTPPWDLLVVLIAKAAVGVAVLRAGFFAFSDDDFSRVVIAERFAVAPTFDPSGTSWLPAPFWLTGSAMAAFGRTFSVARGVAVLLGLVSAFLVHRAARLLGASRMGAALGAIVATTIPTAARLGVSFQPEALTAGLVVFGVATGKADVSRRLTGALSLATACLCRYDAWPVAAAFALFCGADARRGAGAERRTLALSALVAAAAPLGWILHGMVAHGDGLFFVHRVAAYRRALGVTETWIASLAAYPMLFFGAEPELTFGGVALVAVAILRGRPFARSWHRPAVLFACLLGFLVLGRSLDGAPTHHAERTLLPLWAGLAIAGAEAGVQLWRSSRPAVLLGVPTVLGMLGTAVRRAHAAETFPVRDAERAIGVAAKAALPTDARLLVDTADFGYFAVIAAFGAPERAAPFDAHDPRAEKEPDPFATPATLNARIHDGSAAYVVVRREHWVTALGAGRLVATRSGFALVDVRAR